jgi:hypothetical protein
MTMNEAKKAMALTDELLKPNNMKSALQSYLNP